MMPGFGAPFDKDAYTHMYNHSTAADFSFAAHVSIFVQDIISSVLCYVPLHRSSVIRFAEESIGSPKAINFTHTHTHTHLVGRFHTRKRHAYWSGSALKPM
eukprot:1088448-Karenia_brevis.AAC.1